jgi:hypothetical protein
MQQSPGSFAAGKQQLETNRLRVSEVHKANNGVLFVAYKISRFPENVQGQKSESVLWPANLANSPKTLKKRVQRRIFIALRRLDRLILARISIPRFQCTRPQPVLRTLKGDEGRGATVLIKR